MARPRIRSLKPEIWHSRDFQALSVLGRLTFIALFSIADDEGRLKSDPGHLATNYLTGCAADEIAVQLQRMEDRGMVVTYRVRGECFIAMRNHAKHQRVDHPMPSELPAPPKFKRSGSRNNGQLEIEPLASDPVESRRNGSDRRGSDRNGSYTGTALAAPAFVSEQVDDLLENWQGLMPGARDVTAQTPAGQKRRASVAKALREYPAADVRDALRGWRWDDWEGRKRNNEPEDCLRPGNIERFRDWERGIDRPVVKVRPKSVDERVRDLLSQPLPVLGGGM